MYPMLDPCDRWMSAKLTVFGVYVSLECQVDINTWRLVVALAITKLSGSCYKLWGVPPAAGASHQRGHTEVAVRLPRRFIVVQKALIRHGCALECASGSRALQPLRADGVDSKSPSTIHHPHAHHSGLKHRS